MTIKTFNFRLFSFTSKRKLQFEVCGLPSEVRTVFRTLTRRSWNSSVARHLKVGDRVKLKQMYRQNIRDVPTNHIKNLLFYSWMKTTAYLLEWFYLLGAVYMEASYPAVRVTRLVGLKKHSIYMKPSYPASMKHMFWNGQLPPAKLPNCANKSKWIPQNTGRPS